ncbi:MAG: hypothetical protein IJS96_00880 [Schwartzia sp.]|nr:hypothetical protein [Schwartzia sp. (in: firmicutes)]
MSYMSGVMMGLAFGKGLRHILSGRPAPKATLPAFALARAIPGRRRYYAKALLGNEALAAAVEKALTRLDFVDEARANPVSGSLLIVYHVDEAAMNAVADRLANRVFTVPMDGPTPMEEAAEGLAAIGRHLHGTFCAISRHLKMVTAGLLDLPSLLSIVFAVRGIRKILLAKQLPSGPQLLWWAFSLLRGWRIA